MQRRTAIVVIAVAAAISPPPPAHAQEPLPVDATHHFPVKFQCGASSETFQEGVVRGVHATGITLHNPSRVRAVDFTKRVSRALPFQRSGAASEHAVDTLPPETSIEVECDEIRMMLPESMVGQFRSGFLQVHATGPLDVVVVYSSRPHAADVSTIDIEVVEARLLKPDGAGGTADLALTDIDLATLRVSCSTGSGGCRAAVDVTVANVGATDSGPFDVLVEFDPRQSVEFVQPVPAGLDAGAKTTFNADVETGAACFDPNCEICATVDPDDEIDEPDEGNNRLCRERAG